MNACVTTARAAARHARVGSRAIIAVTVLSMVATLLTLGATARPAAAAASDISSMGFYGSELVWQPGDPQPIHDTATNTVSSFGPIKDVVCGSVMTFLQEIVMSASGVDDVLEISYEFGYDSSANQSLGLRDIVGLTIHPDSTDLDGDAAVSLVSESIDPNNGDPDDPGTVRVYMPVIAVSGLDANETIWVQIEVVVGCDAGTGSSGTAQAVYGGAVETTSGEPLGGGAQTIPGLSPSAPPSWSFMKEAFDSAGDPVTVADPFQEITFRFTVGNTGLLGLAPPTLTDTDCAPITFVGGDLNTNNVIDASSPLWPNGTFDIEPAEPAEVWVWECTTAIGSGDHTNTATLAGMPPKGVGSTESTVAFPVNPKIVEMTVTKTADPLYFEAPATTTWTIAADNTGNVPLLGVTMSDPDCSSPTFVAATDTNANNELDVDETWQWTCVSASLSATTSNTASVSAADPEGTPAGGSAIATTTLVALTLDKVPPVGPIDALTDVTYTFVVRNTGDATLDPVVVNDPLTGPVTCLAAQLAPGAETTCSAIYTVTQDDLDAGVINNSATVTGTAPDGVTTTSASDSESTLVTQSPAWTVVKSTASEPAAAGETLDYSFVVDNTGNVSIATVVVTDAKCAATPILSGGDTDLDSELDPDETWTFTCTSIPVTQDEVDATSVDNDVVVTGDPAGGVLGDAIAAVETPVVPAPAWELVKSTSSLPSSPGDVLVYSFAVDNTGNVSIRTVGVADPKCASGPDYQSGDTDLDSELDPDETWTFTCTSIPVTQVEVDAGVVNNTATASGTPAAGTLESTDGSSSVTIAPVPGWTVVKSTASAPTAAGDTLVYSFVVENTGNVSIGDVVVSDAKCAAAAVLVSGDLDTDTEIDADEVWTFTCTSIAVTQSEVDGGAVDNDVSVVGAPVAGVLDPAVDDVSTPIAQTPTWTVDKLSVSAPTDPGDTLVYSFVVDNTGNVTITGVTVTDAKCAADPVLDAGDTDLDTELDVDETWTFSCTSIPVTQAEVDAGQVDNSVDVAGTPLGGTLANATDVLSVLIDATPALEVIKAATSTPSEAGDTIGYTFTVVNTGNVSISNVTVTDAKCAAAPVLDSESLTVDGVIEDAETFIFSCTSIPVTQTEVDAGQVDNSVIVDGDPVAGTLIPAEDDHTITISGAPAWSLVKATSSSPTAAGQTLDYSFSVVNTGNVSMTSVSIADDKCAAVPTLTNESIVIDGVLEVGETQIWSCTSVPITQDEVNAGQVDNTATATAIPVSGTVDPAVDDHSAPVPASPSWDFVKATSSTPMQAGETLAYSFEVDNTGNVSISDVLIADPKCDTGPTYQSGDANLNDALDPDETWIYTCTSIGVTQDEIDAGKVDNTATATGTPAGGVLTPAESTVSTPIASGPEWTLIKSTASAPTEAGDTLDYSFSLVNTGNVSITDVEISDGKCSTTPALVSESLTTNDVLEVGETWILTCTSIEVTQVEIDAGVVNNTATATGTPAGGTLAPAEDDHAAPISQAPSMQVVKSTSSTPVQAGDTLDYSFSVVNNGNVSINSVVVVDFKCAAASSLDLETVTSDGVLEVGETQIWSCPSIPVSQAEIDAGRIDNTVTVSGTPAGGSLESATDDHTVLVVAAPAWSVMKTTSSVPTEAGDTLVYSFTVSNDGNVSISGVTVADPKCATLPALTAGDSNLNSQLDAGETWIYTCTSVGVTQAEVDAGQVDNTVLVTGNPLRGTLDAVTDDLSTPIIPFPAWSVVKASASSPAAADATIDYTFTIVNTGNVTMTAIVVTDPKCATTPIIDSESVTADGELEAGETQIWSCTSIPVTQAEIDAGEVLNDVTVTASAPGGVAPAIDDHLVPIAAGPSWELVKSTSSVPANADETLLYVFSVLNTGNVTIDAVSVTDPKCATLPVITGESIALDGTLDVLETQTWSCTSVPVTQAEVDAGKVDNTALATGTPARGTLDDAVDDLSTPITPTPAWSVAKVADSSPDEAGDTLGYSFILSNDGNVSIADVAVSDAKCSLPPVLVSGDTDVNSVLDVGEVWTYSCISIPITQAEVDTGQVDNFVSTSGTPAGGTLPPATDDLTTPIVPLPEWAVAKTTSSIPTVAGETLDYTFNVVNSGNVTITIIDVADAKCAADPILVSESITADTFLQVGETQIWSCTSIPVTQDEIDAGEVLNEVVVQGEAAGGTLEPVADDLVTTLTQEPSWIVLKSTSSEPFAAGETLDYTFTVINDGNVTITVVDITDAKCVVDPVLVSESDTPDTILQVGETQIWSCTSIPVTQVEVDAGQIDNTATFFGEPAGGTLDPAVGEASTPVPAAPSTNLAKSTTSVPTAAGDTLVYTFAFLNTGNVSILAPVVTDAKCDASPTLDAESLNADGVLEAGETQTWSCTSVAVTQAEVDAGEVLNSASATGDPAGGILVPATDDLAVPVNANPAMELVKASDSAVGAAGDTIEYTFSLLNTGNVSILAPVVTDAKCDASPTLDAESVTADGALEVGETQTWSCTSVAVTQAEVDAGEVLNSASATGTPTGGLLSPAFDDHVIVVTANPAVDVVKSTSSTVSSAGEELTYTFTVVNSGNVTVTGPAVSDAKCATTPVIDSESIDIDGALQAGETQIWSCTSVAVTQAEVDAGAVDNTVTVTGTPSGGTLDPTSDDHTVPVTPAPSWSVVKSTVSLPSEAGDTLDYTFVVTNGGNVNISDVTVSDAKCAADPVLDTESITLDGVLEPGEEQGWSCTSIAVTQTEVDAGAVENNVSVSGVPAGGVLDPATDSHVAPVDSAPALVVIKATTSVPGAAGDTLDYSFTVVNNGNVTITDVTVTDAKCVADPVLDTESITADGVVEPGETQIWTCTSVPVTQTEVDAGLVENDVLVSGVPAGGILDPVSDDHSAPIAAGPGFALVKAAVTTPVAVWDTVDYAFTVVNTGNVTITDVVIADPKCATSPVIDAESITANGVLEAGETQIWVCISIPVTESEADAGVVENTATLSGTPLGGTLDPITDTEYVDVVAMPAWTLTKSTLSNPGAAGDTLDYTFVVENTGNVSIGDVAVSDLKCDSAPELIGGDVDDDARLGYDETWTYTCTSIPVIQAEVDTGAVTNTATASGTPAGGDLAAVEGSTSTPIAPAPSIDVVKTTASVPGGADETLDYTFTVVNNGNVTITAVTITDAKCATSPIIDSESIADDTVLAVGETQIWSCTSVAITQAEVDAGEIINTATITGTPVRGTFDPVPTEHIVPLSANPAVEIVKATASNPTAAGDTLDYTFTVVNTGNVTVSDLVVADNRCAAAPALTSESISTDAVLQVGETQVWSCTSIAVTQVEVDNGIVANTVIVTGVPTGGQLPEVTDTVETTVPALPAWSVVKTTTSTPLAAGDTLDYVFAVTNDGNVSITDVAPVDDKCATTLIVDSESVAVDGVLVPGETQVWSCTSIAVTQDEVDAGQVDNLVSVTGTPTRGTLPEATDTNVTTVSATGSLELIKAVAGVFDANDNGLVDADDVVSWSFSITNTGNVVLSDVTVTDSFATVAGGPIVSLAPGETDTDTITASHTLTQADIDLGRIDNSALGTGRMPQGTIAEDISDSSDPTDTGSVNDSGTPIVDGDGNPVDDGDPDNDPTRFGIDPAPDMSLLKMSLYIDANANEVVDVGDEILYTFEVENTGTVTLTDITIDDALVTIDGGPIASLAPGAVDSTTFSALYVVTSTDIDAGGVENSALATGSAPNGDPVEDVSDDPVNDTNVDPDNDGNPDDPTVTALTTNPSLAVIKTVASAPIGAAGDQVIYEIEVTNNGNVTLTDVVVNDSLIDPDAPICDSTTDVALASMAPGASVLCVAAYTVTQADIDRGGVTNSAVATGLDPSDTEVTDVSDSGSDTPPGNDGSGTDDPTYDIIDPRPELNLVKSVVATDPSPITGPGAIITFELVVMNTGNVTLDDVTVTDALVDPVCPTGAAATLAPLASLTCTASYTVTQADIDGGGVTNTALATGTDPSDTEVIDLSDSGSDTPPGNDGSGTDDPTFFAIADEPSLRLAKTVGNLESLGDGSWAITWVLDVLNDGNVTVDNVQVVEDLASNLSPGTITSPVAAVTAGSCTPNASYDGSAVTGALTGTDQLAPGESCTVSVSLILTPESLRIQNTALAVGNAPDGGSVDDVSDSGDETVETPDANGETDDDPTNDPTVVDLTEDPGIGVAKSLSAGPEFLDDGGWSMSFTLLIENVGDVPLANVQLIENLDNTFDGSPFELGAVSVIDGSCTRNTGFDGNVDPELLTGNDIFAVGAMCTVEIDLVARPDGRFLGENQVTVSGVSPGGTTVTDLSVIGTSVDPDGNGNPDEEAPNPFALIPPAAPDEDLDNTRGTAVTIDPLVNDGSGVPLDPTSVTLIDPITGGVAGNSVTVPGEGVWTVNQSNGLVTFTPQSGFVDDPKPIGYQVTVEGTDVVLTSAITVTYAAAPITRVPYVAPPASSYSPPPAPPAPAPAPAPEGPLAFTGSNATTLAALASLLILCGSGMVIGARRRRESYED